MRIERGTDMSFTTTLVGRAKDFSKVASAKAKELTSRAKTNISIVDIESDMEGLYRALGQLVYNAAQEPGDEAITAKADEIIGKLKEKEEALSSLRQRSQELRKIKICTCGRENGSDSEYCSKCGSSLL